MGREKWLMVHADDFGLSSSINQGVLSVFKGGLVTAASLIVNGAASEEACRIAAAHPGLAVGLHINLTHGKPLRPPSQISSLVDGRGDFWPKPHFFARCLCGRIKSDHLHDEIMAQVEWMASRDLSLSHLNSHHHVHLLPAVAAVVGEIAGLSNTGWVRTTSAPSRVCFQVAGMVPVAQQLFLYLLSRKARKRWPSIRTADRFWGFEFARAADKKRALRTILQRLGPGRHELMCHPAMNGGIAMAERNAERTALCDKRLPGILRENEIRLFAPQAGMMFHH